jgi:methyl-accepting chemotaxis protein
MKNLKVAVKIGAGFALVIAIAAGLGAVQLWNMMGVQGEANRLDKEIVPQVAVANDLERSVHRTMYSMQAFLQSMDTDALDQAKQFLSDTQKYLADADALSAKYPRLVVLRKNVAEAKPSVDEYAKLVDDTIAVNASITVERMNQASSGTTFNTTVQNYILKKTADLNALISRHASTAELKSTLQELTTANEVRDLGNGLRIGNFETQATSDPSFLKDAMASFADVANRITSWRALPTVNKDDLIQLDAVSSSGNNYLQASQTVLDDVVKRSEVNAAQRKTADVVLDAALQTSLEGFKDAATITTLTVARLMTAIIVLVMGVAAATVMGIAVAIAITRTITRPLFKGVAFAQQIARGDFSTLLDIQQRDEVGALASALNEMAIKLRDVVLSVQESASQVAHSSEEISTGAQKLAEGAQNQATTLEQTSAAVEELAASVDEVSAHAQSQAAAVEEGSSSMALVHSSLEAVTRSLGEISGLARRSAENAVEGDKAVQSVVEVINLISGGSEKIGGIVGVISDIADQTNLLALNAAIEAARAGEHGRGFAVVADEVSKLAERSASSTKEIAVLIKESVKNISEGVKTARGSQIAMEQIRAASQQVNDTITALSESMGQQVSAIKELAGALENISEMSQGISAATEEQTSNAKQVSKAVETVNELTQAAAASAEEMSSSTEKLTAMAQGLNRLVALFKMAHEAPVDEPPREEGRALPPPGAGAAGEETHTAPGEIGT